MKRTGGVAYPARFVGFIMANYYDPFGMFDAPDPSRSRPLRNAHGPARQVNPYFRGNPPQRPGRNAARPAAPNAGGPTLGDYERLQAERNELVDEMKRRNDKLTTQSDALRRQGEHLQELGSRLKWTEAALRQAQKSSAFAEAARQPQTNRPTPDDYERLQSERDQLSEKLKRRDNELAIKSEALRRQGEDLRDVADRLMWTEAALKQVQKAEGEEETSWRERYMRLQAELDNLRQRLEQRSEAQVAAKRDDILRDMLPLADHLDLALQHVETLDEPSADLRNFTGNIQATRSAFLETLRRYGVERMDAQGAPFDPNLHEALSQIASDKVPADHVAQVVQAGYINGEQLLRPARVLVSSGGSEQ